MSRLADIIGHEHAMGILQRALGERRLHHSMIFHGPEAVGKRTVALALASTLNCLDPTTSNGHPVDACGECSSCGKVNKGIHADVAFLTLERTMIPIDGIRRLRDEAAYRPFEGTRRVFIIDPADRMSIAAQNALLKTLEEPSSSSCIILITSRPMHLLPTTRSRCQALSFGPLHASAVTKRLIDTRGMSRIDAERVARLSGGRLGAALELDLEEHDATRASILGVLGRAADDRPRDHVATDMEAFGPDAAEMSASLNILRGLMRDMVIISSGASDKTLAHGDIADELRDLGSRLASDTEGLLNIADRVELAADDLERNVNKKLLVETLLLDIAAQPAAP